MFVCGETVCDWCGHVYGVFVCMIVFLCVLGAQCNHSSNLSARNLCVGDIKVLISTVTQHQCHCEDTNDTSTPAASTHRVCVRVCVCLCLRVHVCVCAREKERLGEWNLTAHFESFFFFVCFFFLHIVLSVQLMLRTEAKLDQTNCGCAALMACEAAKKLRDNESRGVRRMLRLTPKSGGMNGREHVEGRNGWEEGKRQVAMVTGNRLGLNESCMA